MRTMIHEFMKRHPKFKFVLIPLVLVTLLMTQAESCDGSTPDSSGQGREAKSKIREYNQVVDQQPAKVMPYSPSRNTISAWGEYWKTPGKLAYTYITDGPNDHKGGYYVFIGPPISNCVGLTSPVQKVPIDLGEYGGQTYIPAPGIDSVYGGGDCNLYYGIDAVTKLPVAFSVGMGQNLTYFAQPNQRYNAEPLGTATFDSAKKG